MKDDEQDPRRVTHTKTPAAIYETLCNPRFVYGNLEPEAIRSFIKATKQYRRVTRISSMAHQWPMEADGRSAWLGTRVDRGYRNRGSSVIPVFDTRQLTRLWW